MKSCKVALKKAVGEQILTPFELYRCLLEVANVVNQRPIGCIPNHPDDGSYVCPNDMLLGRTTSRHKARLRKPTIHVSEWSLFRRLSTRFGSGGHGMYFHH